MKRRKAHMCNQMLQNKHSMVFINCFYNYISWPCITSIAKIDFKIYQ